MLNEQYAIAIARDRIAFDLNSEHVGLVTAFTVPAEFLRRIPEKVVDGRNTEEIWIPAEELPELNAHIVGKIRLNQVFYGEAYSGPRGIGGFPG